MKRNCLAIAKDLIVVGLLLLYIPLHAQKDWPALTQENKPWTRWWWMGSAVDSAGISWQISEMKKAGFGGVEIVPIYGAKGHEEKYLNYLSPSWMKMLDFTVAEAAAADMGVYLAAGTGWPIGGPQVTKELAATKLVVKKYSYVPGTPFKEKITAVEKGKPGVLVALIAYNSTGKALDLTNKVSANGELQWNPSGVTAYDLYAAFYAQTGQMVKRAAPGGEGFTLDHFSTDALKGYLKSFDNAFGKDLHGVKAFYNDSYEVYGANWTAAFFDVFKQRRGYDLKPYLRQLVSDIASDSVARLKSDYRETISDLMVNNFANTFSKWSHSKGALSLNQAHGSPGNLLDIYAAADIPECETFGSSYFAIPGLRRDSADIRNVDPDPVMLQFAASAGHVMGRKFVSNETFTWLGEHFKTSWSQCKPEVEQVFLAGVNHMFYHGSTYSPQHAAWPGWLFYASLNVVPANSLWPHLNALNNYISRCQSVLQEGSPDNEIAVYWPVYDIWHNAKSMDMALTVHGVDQWLHKSSFYKLVNTLQHQGYMTDFFSDNMLAGSSVKGGQLLSAGNTSYKLLIIPEAGIIPERTIRKVLGLVKAGATVIMQSSGFKEPGLKGLGHTNDITSAGAKFITLSNGMKMAKINSGQLILANNIQEALNYLKVGGEKLQELGLKFIRRQTGEGKTYYIVNHTAQKIDKLVPLHFTAANAILLDPQTGKAGSVNVLNKEGYSYTHLQLLPGEALIVKLGNHPNDLPAWTVTGPEIERIVCKNPWQLSFREGGPVLPAQRTLPVIRPWTSLNDKDCEHFSGTGVYSTTIAINDPDAAYELHIDSLYESAKVSINGKEIGIIWSIPYKLDVSGYLQKGENQLKIEVANLMANRIRYMDQEKISWKNYHEINFVNINYKPFDASEWKVMPSGIAGDVWLSKKAGQ